MTKIFKDMLHKTVECYVDDLAVKSRDKEDHLQDLRAVFERLRQHNLKMNPRLQDREQRTKYVLVAFVPL